MGLIPWVSAQEPVLFFRHGFHGSHSERHGLLSSVPLSLCGEIIKTTEAQSTLRGKSVSLNLFKAVLIRA